MKCFIKVRFNTYPEGYANKNFAKYALSEMPDAPKLGIEGEKYGIRISKPK